MMQRDEFDSADRAVAKLVRVTLEDIRAAPIDLIGNELPRSIWSEVDAYFALRIADCRDRERRVDVA